MPKRMTVREVRRKLREMDHRELSDMVVKMYRNNEDVRELVNLAVVGEEYKAAMLAEAKADVRKMILPARGKVARLSQAKRVTMHVSQLVNEDTVELDLVLHYLECCADLLEEWDIKGGAYEPMEEMYVHLIDMLERTEDPALYEGVRERLYRLDRRAGSLPFEFGDFIRRLYRNSKWIKSSGEGMNKEAEETKRTQIAERTEQIQKAQEMQQTQQAEEMQQTQKTEETQQTQKTEETQQTQKAKETRQTQQAQFRKSAAVKGRLTEENSNHFYALWWPLLEYVYRKKAGGKRKKKTVRSMEVEIQQQIADILWDETSLIDEYLKEKGENISEEDREIMLGWKKAVRERFVFERSLDDGAVLISANQTKVYQVCGIKSAWREMFRGFSMPVLCEAVLLPFKDVIISDGYIIPKTAFFSGDMVEDLNELYVWTRDRGRVIDSL